MTDSTKGAEQAVTDSTGTTGNALSNDGQTVSKVQTTDSGPGTEETFFDPTSIAGKPELELAYKQMQREFTKRNKSFKDAESKVKLYDQVMADPVNSLRQLATQYGYQMLPQAKGQEDFNPQNWDDVMARAKQEVLKDMKPVFEEVRTLKKQSIETYLDTNHSDWRTYESQMMDTLKTHPSLVNDPDALYRLSVPQSVIESRATKAAMQKLKDVSDGAQVSGQTNVKQLSQKPSGPLTFEQAADWARKQVAGIRRPA